MRYVLDSSVALKWVLNEPDAGTARRLRQDFRQGAHELLAPDIFPVEVAHALTKAERLGRIAAGAGGVLWQDVMSSPPRLVPTLPLIPRAYDIASNARIGIYDCLYVALAEREGRELVTADGKLFTNLRTQFPFIVDLASVP